MVCNGLGTRNGATRKLDFLRVSFLIAGHTKFSPDLVFAKIAKTYNRSDVFNTELKSVIVPHADVVVDRGEIVCDWRMNLTIKAAWNS